MSKITFTKGRKIHQGDIIILNPEVGRVQCGDKYARLNRLTGNWITNDGRIASTRKQAEKLIS